MLTVFGTVDDGMIAVIHDMTIFRWAGLVSRGIAASQKPCKHSMGTNMVRNIIYLPAACSSYFDITLIFGLLKFRRAWYYDYNCHIVCIPRVL